MNYYIGEPTKGVIVAEKMINIGVPESMYNEMVKLQEEHKKKYNGNKAFYQVIEDWKRLAGKENG